MIKDYPYALNSADLRTRTLFDRFGLITDASKSKYLNTQAHFKIKDINLEIRRGIERKSIPKIGFAVDTQMVSYQDVDNKNVQVVRQKNLQVDNTEAENKRQDKIDLDFQRTYYWLNEDEIKTAIDAGLYKDPITFESEIRTELVGHDFVQNVGVNVVEQTLTDNLHNQTNIRFVEPIDDISNLSKNSRYNDFHLDIYEVLNVMASNRADISYTDEELMTPVDPITFDNAKDAEDDLLRNVAEEDQDLSYNTTLNVDKVVGESGSNNELEDSSKPVDPITVAKSNELDLSSDADYSDEQQSDETNDKPVNVAENDFNNVDIKDAVSIDDELSLEDTEKPVKPDVQDVQDVIISNDIKTPDLSSLEINSHNDVRQDKAPKKRRKPRKPRTPRSSASNSDEREM